MDSPINEPTPDYLKGFNDGYLIAKHEPELAAKLKDIESSSERIKGFKEGIVELTKEKNKEFYPQWLKENKNESVLDKEQKDKSKEQPFLDKDKE